MNSLVNQPADYSGGSIQRIDLEQGTVTTLYRECDGHRLSAPNDIVFDSSGGFWFTDSGKTRARDRDWGGVFYAQPDGSSIQEVIHPLDSPNGIGLSPDGDRLYVADTTTGRLWWWDVHGPGAVDHDRSTGRGRHLAGAPEGAPFFDSLAVEADGGICVGTLFRGGITTFRPDSTVEFVALPDRMVTNICFGGADLTTAYVTLSSLGQLAARDLAPSRPPTRLESHLSQSQASRLRKPAAARGSTASCTWLKSPPTLSPSA